MNQLLWTAQVLVAVVMLLTGSIKLLLDREQLAKRMHWAASWPRERIKLLGLAEIAGAFGLIVPWATHIATVLTPIAAACLAVLMVGAVATHVRLRENPLPAVIVLVLCAAIAAGRFVAVT
jgi:hypothetical protein